MIIMWMSRRSPHRKSAKTWGTGANSQASEWKTLTVTPSDILTASGAIQRIFDAVDVFRLTKIMSEHDAWPASVNRKNYCEAVWCSRG
jgi:hypothetical protein